MINKLCIPTGYSDGHAGLGHMAPSLSQVSDVDPHRGNFLLHDTIWISFVYFTGADFWWTWEQRTGKRTSGGATQLGICSFFPPFFTCRCVR